jgi:hypothetical protein
MSKELNSRYPNVYRFIEAFQGFEKFYEENSNSGIDFTNFLLKLNIFDNFVTSVIEKMELETGLELVKKLDSDSDYMLKAIEEKINNKNDLFFLTKNKSLVQISESSSEESSDDDSDHSSVSSIEDINSKNSESEEDEEENQNELTIQTNKMISSSLVELKIRKKVKDFDTEKIEEE